MLYVPFISDYKPFYIQFRTGFAIDILNSYSVVVKAHDYPASFKVKEPYKNQWKDEHGDEEYIAQDGLKFEAFTFRMECVMFARGATLDAAIADLKNGVAAFRNALMQGFMRTYDSWTGWGFKDVRVDEFQPPSDSAYGAWNDYARVIFTVVLKVNDPITSMKYNPSLNLIVEG